MDQTQFNNMIAGRPYLASDEYLTALRYKARAVMDKFNSLPFNEPDSGMELLRGLFNQLGKDSHINKPLYFDYGCNISVGTNFFANYDCIFLDVAPITIGNNVMLGPRVSLFTATHPLDAKERATLIESGAPITIGDNVWIGGNAVINPGVTIGANTVIGAGSVVTKDIPANCVAAGNPCRVIRRLQ